MKLNSWFFCGISFILFHDICAQPIKLHYIDTVRVNRQAVRIGHTLKTHRYINNGIIVAMLVHQIGSLVKFGSTYIAPYFVDSPVLSGPTLNTKDTQNENKTSPTFWQAVKCAPQAFKHFITSGECIYAFCSLVKDVATYSIVTAGINAMIKKVQHPDTILWYVSTQVRYHTACQLALKQAHTTATNQEKQATTQQLLVCTCNGLVSKILSVLAYIKYKEQLLVPSHARQLHMIGCVYLQQMGDWIVSMQTALQDNKYDVVVLLIEQLESELDRLVEACALHEPYLKNDSIWSSL